LILENLFLELAVLLGISALVGFLGRLARQPLIVAFILAGILAGPSVFDIVRSDDNYALLSDLGIAVLLFLVGLKLDVKLIRSIGMVSIATGLGQVGFTAAFGFVLCVVLGYDPVTSIYIAVALTFSSTIIIVKLLSDKRETDSLHGQIALGFLIVQDIVVVLAMIALSAVGVGTRQDVAAQGIGDILLSGAVLLVGVLIFVRYLANPLSERLAQSPELLLIFGIALAAMLAAAGEHLGFGKELGGLLAGVALASTPYREALAARLAPLRDFLLLFFFIALGSGLEFGDVGAGLGAATVLSLFVLIGNPLIVVVIMVAMGYRVRTGFLAGLTVAQISEFSLVFMAMGVRLGHVDSTALGTVTLVGLITIAISTYMITYSHALYSYCERLLSFLEFRAPSRESTMLPASTGRYDVIIFGLGRYGTAIAERLRSRGSRVLAIDFNPLAVRAARNRQIDAFYGDVSDPEYLAELPYQQAEWVISAIPDHEGGLTHEDVRLTIIQAVRAAGYAGRIAVRSRSGATGPLLASGADLVLQPFRDGADRAIELLDTHQQPKGAGN
jgi:Kef-type K+ transport system membrane component KefB